MRRTQERTAEVIERMLRMQGMHLDPTSNEDVMSPEAGIADSLEAYQTDHDFITGDHMRELLLEAEIDPNDFKTAMARDPEGFRDWVIRNLAPLN